MANKHVKIYSVSLIPWEIGIKITMRYLTLIKCTKFKRCAIKLPSEDTEKL